MAEQKLKEEVVRQVDQRRLAISASVRVIPHFPKPGKLSLTHTLFFFLLFGNLNGG
jgi:hypothetical protein